MNAGESPNQSGPQGFEPPPVEHLDAVLDSYDFIEILGRGGMGAVYKARQRNLDPRYDDLIERAIDGNRDSRFQHASEIASTLYEIQTTPASAPDRPEPITGAESAQRPAKAGNGDRSSANPKPPLIIGTIVAAVAIPAIIAAVTVGGSDRKPDSGQRSAADTESANEPFPVPPGFLRPPGNQWIDLIPLIDPDVDAVQGNWAIEDGALHLRGGSGQDSSLLALPALSGGSYRIRLTMSGDGAVPKFSFILPVSDAQCQAAISTGPGRNGGHC